MKQAIITEINNYIYTLKTNDKEYSVYINFYLDGIKIKVGDYLILDEYYLKEKAMYSFGYLNSKFGKDITNINDKDIIILINDDKKYYLKRLYG